MKKWEFLKWLEKITEKAEICWKSLDESSFGKQFKFPIILRKVDETDDLDPRKFQLHVFFDSFTLKRSKLVKLEFSSPFGCSSKLY